MNEFAKWANFYVIVGSAAGALIGLQFVVLTLVGDRPFHGMAEAGAAFGSPTIVHFSVTLFLSALLNAPWRTISIPLVTWGMVGFVGVVYVVVITRRMLRQPAYKPQFEDWLFYSALPMVAYAVLAASSFVPNRFDFSIALFMVGGSALLLLFVGIHNAWDSVSYHVFVASPKEHAARDRGDSK